MHQRRCARGGAPAPARAASAGAAPRGGAPRPLHGTEATSSTKLEGQQQHATHTTHTERNSSVGCAGLWRFTGAPYCKARAEARHVTHTLETLSLHSGLAGRCRVCRQPAARAASRRRDARLSFL